MAMNATQSAAQGLARCVEQCTTRGTGQSLKIRFQWLACAIIALAQDAGGDAPTINAPFTIPAGTDNSTVSPQAF